AILASAVLAAGCSETMQVKTRGDDALLYADVPPPSSSSTLDLSIAATAAPNPFAEESPPKMFANLLRKPGIFKTVVPIESLEAPWSGDIVASLAWGNFNTGELTVYSAYTREELFSATLSCGFKGLVAYPDCLSKKASGLIYQAFSGTPRHAQILKQREAALAKKKEEPPASLPQQQTTSPAPMTAPAAPAGLSKEELQQMMAEAVKAAAKPSAPTAQPSVSSDVDTPSYRNPENADNFAVVVGVENYNGLPDAQFAERDAKAVYEHLIALGYPQRNIALLTGARATRTGLVKNLEAWLPQNVNERSTVFFYYSGHGAPDPAAGTAFLVPADGDPQYLEETSYPVKRVYEKLGALKAKRVLVAMDSCFSGSGGRSVLAKGTRPLVGKIDLGSVGGKVVSLTASAASQISGTAEEQGHGLFTYFFLRGLNGDAKDAAGSVTVKSLFGYLSPRVQDVAKRGNRDQTPQLLPFVLPDGGDVRLR
ncbi:MAG: caspase family protein, partial [Elusimicrobia bacterium]|nr:caspase family protein [Elusimicrobiota bacterium]